MTDRELLEFIAAQVGNLTAEVKELKTDLNDVKTEFKSVKNTVIKIEMSIENEIKPDIKLALQGYHDLKQDTTVIKEQLNKIEKEVTKHDDIIFKRIK